MLLCCNAVADRENILNAFDWLVEGAAENDALFFHYSGHGGQVRYHACTVVASTRAIKLGCSMFSHKWRQRQFWYIVVDTATTINSNNNNCCWSK